MATALARKFQVDVTADLTLAGGWMQLNGINDLKPSIDPNMVDTSAYDTNGWGSSEITSNAWSLTAGFFRRNSSGVYDSGQELCRARIGQFGTAARVGVRWYEKNNGASAEAYSGVAVVKWEKGQTGVNDVETVNLTLAGDGVLTAISNPWTATVVPTVSSVTPSGVAVGGQFVIAGQNFTGTVPTTGVKVGVTNATSWIVVSDSLITAIMPAGSSGATTVTVTNAAGASNALAYVRGA